MCCSTGVTATAGEVNSIQVLKQDGRHGVKIDASIHALPDIIRSLLTDYENLNNISPAVSDSTVRSVSNDRIYRVYNITRLCILIYCADIKQMQDLEQRANGDLTATIIPDEDDFKRGTATWRLTNGQMSTRLRFEGDLDPNIWVLPLIGCWLIRQLLYREAVQTVLGFKRLYHER